MHKVWFAHGKESGPNGSKIQHLSDIARSLGAPVVSPDYSDLDDPDRRVVRLEKLLLEAGEPAPILVGSSMGGYVSAVVASRLQLAGLFLMAPALYMPGYETGVDTPRSEHVSIVHGWQDDIIPWKNSLRYAEKYRASLHLINSDHRLSADIEEVGELFQRFLSSLPENSFGN